MLGLLAGFLVFLMSILRGGVELFDEGEAGQELADLGNAAAIASRQAFEDMVGPVREYYEPGPPDARLIVQWVPFGVNAAARARTQAIRATVRLDDATETALLRRSLFEQARESARSEEPDDVEQALRQLVAAAPRSGRGTTLFMAWPAADDKTGHFLELRRASFLLGEEVQVGDRAYFNPLAASDLDQQSLPAKGFVAFSDVVATGVLHFQVDLWSQLTGSFDGQAGGDGPERAWDSARAGLFDGIEDRGERFSLDLGPHSFANPTDDVYPRWVRVTVVVARASPPARLAHELSAGETEFRVITTNPLPDLEDVEFLKIGSEWVKIGSTDGRRIKGVRRGQRATRAVNHQAGTPVRAGKTVQLRVRLAHGRDHWNE